MHIVVDLQSVQSGSQNRGIGRYSLSLTLALARIFHKKHRFSLLLNSDFKDFDESILSVFKPFISAEDFYFFCPLAPCDALEAKNSWRRKASEALYSSFIEKINPDFLVVTSLFEGGNAINSMQFLEKKPIVAVVLYDLIPLIYSDMYLSNSSISKSYWNCLGKLHQADLLLAISESSRQEAIDYISFDQNRVVNISSAIDGQFKVLNISKEHSDQIRKKYRLKNKFIMYTGGIDHRKNIENLISSYSCLRPDLRLTHQLVIVCSIEEHTKKELIKKSKQEGLRDGELILTGFVSDEDLIALYNICELFIFPSWHEGFGLPILEAMACGAVVIAGNRSSLPEVLGFEEGLFDPFDQSDMTRSIERGLTDEEFRISFKNHVAQQLKKFSWESSAMRAVEAMEELYKKSTKNSLASRSFLKPKESRPRMAYISPIQSAHSGIADYSADLLPYLAKYYEIDVIVDQVEMITDPWVLAISNQKSVSTFKKNYASYDRVLYHVGNSHYHTHILNLIEDYPGVIVLHDFFLSGIISFLEVGGTKNKIWQEALWFSHGWTAINHRFDGCEIDEVINKWPCNLAVLERASGVIVHSQFSRSLADQFYGRGYADNWSVIPLLRIPVINPDRLNARQELGLRDDEVLFCSFGFIAETKLTHRIIDAWLEAKLSRDRNCRLVFVGQASGPYGDVIKQISFRSNGQIKITGWADEKLYKLYLAAADVAVQLRSTSRGETSASVLDAMNYGIATIANANGSMDEIGHENVYMLEDNFSTQDLIFALEELRENEPKRLELGLRGRDYVHNHHKPAFCAEKYCESIEKFYGPLEKKVIGFSKKITSIGAPEDLEDVGKLADIATKLLTDSRHDGFRQILVDISSLQHAVLTSSIQKQMLKVLLFLLTNPPQGSKIEPIYATSEHGYRYARKFTAKILDLKYIELEDEPIFVKSGDVFWGLSSQANIVPVYAQELILLKRVGVKVVFSIFDTLPLFFPESLSVEKVKEYNEFIRKICSFSDGLIFPSCIVLDDFKKWLDGTDVKRKEVLFLGLSELGSVSDCLEESKTPECLAVGEYRCIDRIRSGKSFLVADNFEKVKMQAQALAAFEVLWSRGVMVSLVLCGEAKHQEDGFLDTLRNHPYKDRNLFVFEGARTSFREAIFDACSCLIVPSIADDCCLSIIESSIYKLPILARDIPDFRNVAGDRINYFSGFSPHDLADAVMLWLQTSKDDVNSKNTEIPFMSCSQSAKKMVDIIVKDQWQDIWAQAYGDELVARYYGSDCRLGSVVGERIGSAVWTTGESGYLTYGPYLAVRRGMYKIIIKGCVGSVGLSGARFDIAVLGGQKVLKQGYLSSEPFQEEQVLQEFILTIEKNYQSLEIRIYADVFSDFCISLVEICKFNDASNLKGEVGRLTEGPDSMISHCEYGKSIMGFWGTHKEILSNVGYKNGRSLYTKGKSGFLIYGPYKGLASGSYILRVYGAVASPDDAWVDLSLDYGDRVIERKYFSENNNRSDGLIESIEFNLEHFVDDIEIRIYVNSATEMRFDCFVIEESLSSPIAPTVSQQHSCNDF